MICYAVALLLPRSLLLPLAFLDRISHFQSFVFSPGTPYKWLEVGLKETQESNTIQQQKLLLLCDFTIRKASQVFGLSTPLPCNLLSFFQPGFLLLLNLLFSMVAQQNSKFLLAFRRHKLAFLPNLGQYPVFHILLS